MVSILEEVTAWSVPMPHPRLLSAFLVSLLTFSMPSLGLGQEPEALFDKKLADDFEPAALIEDSSAEDGSLAVIFVARKKNLKPAKWPSIIPGVSINATSLMEEDDKYTVENWIVSPKDKKRLGVVKSSEEYFRPYYNGQNHQSLAVLWGPEQEGWRYGVLNYCGRWGCDEIFFVNCDGESAKTTSMHALLDRFSKKSIVAQKKDPEHYVIGYELLGFVNPEASVTVSDSIKLRIAYFGQIPKADDDGVEGVITLELSRDSKGLSTATVLSVKDGPRE